MFKFKSIWGHWGHLCDKSRNINFASSWSGCIQSEIGSPAVTVHSLCLRLLWSFFFSRRWFKCEHFFFPVFQVFQLVSACRWDVRPALLSWHHQHYMRCVWEAWDFSALRFCFTSSLNYRAQIIHVVSRQGAAAASACGDSLSVCVCVCIIYSKPAGVLSENVCYVRVCVSVCVCVCCNSHSK